MPEAPPSHFSRLCNQRRSKPQARRGQFLLDVSARSERAVQRRHRQIIRFVAKFLIAICVGATLYFTVKRASAWLLVKNLDYSIAELPVETDGQLKSNVVLEAAGLRRGSNIFLVDLGRAQAKIEALPQVEKALVTRELPNRIIVRIYERKPAAWLAPKQLGQSENILDSHGLHLLVDFHGMQWLPSELPPQYCRLPIIRNYDTNLGMNGQEVDGEEIKAALDLLHAIQNSAIASRFQIVEIDIAKQFGLEVKDRNGLRVTFGLDDMDRQLKRLGYFLQAIDQRNEKAETINLLSQKNVPVTFVSNSSILETHTEASPDKPSTIAAEDSRVPVTLAKRGKSSSKRTTLEKKSKNKGNFQPFDPTP